MSRGVMDVTVEQMQRDTAYRVIVGNDTIATGDLVWMDSAFAEPHLNSMQQAACLDTEGFADGTAGLVLKPQPHWLVETKPGPGGHSHIHQDTHGILVVLSIHKQYLDKILSGEKTIEVRRNWPQANMTPFTVLLYETAAGRGTQKIRARATCTGCTLLRDTDIYSGQHENIVTDFSKQSCLTVDALKTYMGHRLALYGWGLEKVRPLEATLSDFGVKRAPQSWCYVKGW